MFIAHCLITRFENDEAVETQTIVYTCLQHSQHELITLIGRYYKAWNRLHRSDYRVQLLSLSDIGQALSPHHVSDVGAIELNGDHVRKLIQEASDKEAQLKIKHTPNPDNFRPEYSIQTDNIELEFKPANVMTLNPLAFEKGT